MDVVCSASALEKLEDKNKELEIDLEHAREEIRTMKDAHLAIEHCAVEAEEKIKRQNDVKHVFVLNVSRAEDRDLGDLEAHGRQRDADDSDKGTREIAAAFQGIDRRTATRDRAETKSVV